MKTVQELQELRNAIAGKPVDGMTVQDVFSDIEKLKKLDQDIAMAAVAPVVGEVYAERAERYSLRAQLPTLEDEIRQGRARPKAKHVSEQNIGRYVMTVLAAILCLLALIVFIMSFWPYMRNELKLFTFLVLGGILEFLGFNRAAAKNMRPFWLGVAGLGAGIILLSCVSGTLLWNLYDEGVTVLLAIMWFVLNYLLAYKQQATVFYVISYIGGLIITAVACAMAVPGVSSEVVLVVLIGAIVATGLCGYYKTQKLYLLVANMAYSFLSACLVEEVYASLFLTDIHTVRELYNPQLLFGFLVLIAAIQVFNIRFLPQKEGLKQLLVNTFITYTNCCMLYSMCELAFTETAGPAVAASIMIVLLGHHKGYMLGCSVWLFSALSSISVGMTCYRDVEEITYRCGALLPAVALLAFCAIPAFMSRKDERAGIVVLGILTVVDTIFPYYRAEHLYYIICFVLLCLSFAAYVYNVHKNNWYFNKPLDCLIFLMVPAVLCRVPVYVSGASDAICFLVASVALSVFGALYLLKRPYEENMQVYVAWYCLRVCVYLALIVSLIMPTQETKVVITIAFTLITVFGFYQAVVVHSRLQSIVSCITANWHIWLVASLWSVNTQLGISISGLLLGCLFILGGFRLNLKAARQCGLICCIVYGLKLGIFDIAGGGLGTAAGLLFAGISCFAVSLAYNKMLKLYDNTDSDG